MQHRSPAVAVGALVILAGMLAACSSGGSSSASKAGTTGSGATVGPAASESGPKPSAGCTTSRAVRAGDAKVTVRSGTATRYYYRHVPRSYRPTEPMPVVVDLHGYAEGASFHRAMSGLGPFGEKHGFVTITPQGSGATVALWDTKLNSADVKFIGALFDDIDRTLCVDQRRVYVTGLSNGAMMTSTIACVYADRVAAVAPVAGVENPTGCKPARAMPIVAYHGTKDPYVSFEGGLGPKALALPAPDGSGKTLAQTGAAKSSSGSGSVPDIVWAWAMRNGCSNPPIEDRVASDVRLVRYNCPTTADTELYRIDGGGHAWPGSKTSQSIESAIGKTTFSISANATMWDFFRAHSLP